MATTKKKVREPPIDEVRREQQRLPVEELGGESEHSLAAAHRGERGSTHKKARGVAAREPMAPEPSPSELAERYLEGATQAPAERREEQYEPVGLPDEDE